MQSRHLKATVFDFMTAEEIEQVLREMVLNGGFRTEPGYSANEMYPNHEIPFVDKHMAYLKGHPKVNPEHYLSNLRLMIRIR